MGMIVNRDVREDKRIKDKLNSLFKLALKNNNIVSIPDNDEVAVLFKYACREHGYRLTYDPDIHGYRIFKS